MIISNWNNFYSNNELNQRILITNMFNIDVKFINYIGWYKSVESDFYIESLSVKICFIHIQKAHAM